jgi:hypothetical protein
VRYFERIAAGIDVEPLLHQITTQPELWNAVPIRSKYGNHASTDDILLRYNRFDPTNDDPREAVLSNIACVNYPAFASLPHAMPIIFGLMARVQGVHLGRVFVSRLPPEGVIPLHSDRDAASERDYPDREIPAVYYERYQLTLRAQTGVVFLAGDERIYMESGTIWWFDNQAQHSVVNNSQDDRIAMTIDIRTYKPVTELR